MAEEIQDPCQYFIQGHGRSFSLKTKFICQKSHNLQNSQAQTCDKKWGKRHPKSTRQEDKLVTSVKRSVIIVMPFKTHYLKRQVQ